MKNILCIMLASFALGAQAQNLEGKLSAPTSTKEGKVIYERVMKMTNVRFGGNLPPEVQAQLEKMPKARTDQFELMFNTEHSLYQYLPNAADEGGGTSTFAGGGAVIQMRAPGVNEVSYVD